jgi:hypothetical protein
MEAVKVFGAQLLEVYLQDVTKTQRGRGFGGTHTKNM